MAKVRMTIPVFIPHLGCPHRCVFCDQWKTSSARSLPDRESIQHRIESYLESASPGILWKELAFFGGNFTGLRPEIQAELLDAAGEYLQNDSIQGIRVSTRPDYIDGPVLNLLRSYGVTTVELGIQSFSDTVLAAAGRGHSSRDSVRAIELLKNVGFKTVIQLMPGLPGEDRAGSLESARRSIGMVPDGMRIYPAVVLSGTEMETLYRSGRYSPLSLEEAVDLCAEILHLCDDADIPVIRTGLHPLSPDAEKNVIAGPYHPAFGFLVKARVKRNLMEKEIVSFGQRETLPHGAVLTLGIPARNIEEYYGSGNENIRYLRNRFMLKRITTLHDKALNEPSVLSIQTGVRESVF